MVTAKYVTIVVNGTRPLSNMRLNQTNLAKGPHQPQSMGSPSLAAASLSFACERCGTPFGQNGGFSEEKLIHQWILKGVPPKISDTARDTHHLRDILVLGGQVVGLVTRKPTVTRTAQVSGV